MGEPSNRALQVQLVELLERVEQLEANVRELQAAPAPASKPRAQTNGRTAFNPNPRWIESLRWDSKCAVCNTPLPQGARAFYVPTGDERGTYCPTHAVECAHTLGVPA